MHQTSGNEGSLENKYVDREHSLHVNIVCNKNESALCYFEFSLVF